MRNKATLVLVVDDSADNQMLMTMLLNSKGYQAYNASNGKEALDLLSELSVLPDLILLDAQMPIMDGYQFRSKQKMIERLKDIPVIVMTATDDSSTSDRMLNPYRVLVKPLDCKVILDVCTAFF